MRSVATNFRRGEEGGAAVELALIAPLLLFFLAGVMLIAHAHWLNFRLTGATHSAARACAASVALGQSIQNCKVWAQTNIDQQVGSWCSGGVQVQPVVAALAGTQVPVVQMNAHCVYAGIPAAVAVAPLASTILPTLSANAVVPF